jgi:serine phosphatase RsbU (regulator of sigma subunit)
MGIALLVIVAGLLIHGNRIQQRANKQLQEANLHIEGQRNQIQQINNNLTASIDYAKLIQDAVLPSDARLSEGLNEAFVIFKPRDVVSGDFYWYHEVGSQIFVAAADCTGHGVPGAFVSMVCHGLLNKIVIEDQVLDPAEILKRAHLGVLSLFKTESTIGQANDGMDIALTIWDKAKKELNFAGAMNPCYVVRNGQIIELEANRRSIGGVSEKEFSFVGQKIDLEDRDMVYIFSDGYKDQFGGPKGKKFMNSRLKKLMLSVADKVAAEQKSIFETEFSQWKEDEDQIDDVLLMGYRIS